MLPNMAPTVEGWDPLMYAGTTIFHKRSPHFFRDYILALPCLSIVPEEFSPEARAQQRTMRRLYADGGHNTIKADLVVKKDAIDPRYLAVANLRDQF